MRRVRTSTWVLLAIFLGTLALYLMVRPPSPSAVSDSPPAAQQRTTPTPTPRASRRPPHRSPTPSPAASPHPTATPHQTVTPHPTIVPTSAPPTSPAPTPSATASATP
jgi:cytoskeletal protein RodZ